MPLTARSSNSWDPFLSSRGKVIGNCLHLRFSRFTEIGFRKRIHPAFVNTQKRVFAYNDWEHSLMQSCANIYRRDQSSVEKSSGGEQSHPTIRLLRTTWPQACVSATRFWPFQRQPRSSTVPRSLPFSSANVPDPDVYSF